MRALIVYAHPAAGSFNAAILATVEERLTAAGIEQRLIDLYAEGFDPCLSTAEFAGYEAIPGNRAPVASHVESLAWCDTLIFVYPTWWYGMPAMLKGWLDRVLLPGVAFLMPDGVNRTIRPGLTNVTRLAVFTTCGASRWLTFVVGAPGKRTLLRGVRLICARRCRTAYAAHYLMDSSTPQSRAAHLRKIAARMDRFLSGGERA